MAVRKDLPSRNSGSDTQMLGQLSPRLQLGELFSSVEPDPPAEASHGRSNGRVSGSVRWGVFFRAWLKRSLRTATALASGARESGRDTRRSDHFTRREYRCRPGPSSRFGIGTVVQLHLRVAIGLQALLRCSPESFRGRARGSTVATHHFVPAWLSSDSSSFVNCRALMPLGSASLLVGSNSRLP